MNLKNKPIGWRTGQLIFVFLEWLLQNGHCPANQNARLADTFYIDDKELEKLYKEFIKECSK